MSSFNKPIPEIQVGVTGFITTTDSSDTFAVTHPFYSAGGFKYSDDIVERDAILPSRRIPEITVVYVDSVDTWFQLQGGITNTDWVSLGSEPFNETLTGSEIKSLYEAELDTNAFTDAEKSKLSGLESSKFLGSYISLAALQGAHTTASPGNYADVDTGVGNDVLRYIWDDDDSEWVEQGAGTTLTAAQVKVLYESNSDTNAFTDSDETKLNGIEAGAEVNVQADWNETDNTSDSFIKNKPAISVTDQGYTPVTDITELNAAIVDTSITNVVVQNIITGSLVANTSSTTKVVGLPLNLTSSQISGTGTVEFYNDVTAATMTLSTPASAKYRNIIGAVALTNTGTFLYEYADSTITTSGVAPIQTYWDNTIKSVVPTLTEYVSLSASTDSPVSKFSRVFKGPVTVDTVSLSFNADISSVSFEAREGNGSVIGLADLADLSTWIGGNIATNDIWQIRAIIVFNASYVGDGECTFKIDL